MRWFIFGHYGGHNTGDEAMLRGLTAFLRPWSKRIVVMTKAGVCPPYLAGPAVHAVKAGLIGLLPAVLQSDAVVLGGGTHFHDDYQPRRYLRHFVYMARIVALTFVARTFRKPVFWIGMGIGPLNRVSARWLTRIGLSLCSGISVRDLASLREVQRLGSHPTLTRAFDLAAQMPAVFEESRNPRTPETGGPSTIGVSLTSVAATAYGAAEFDEQLERSLAKCLGERLRADGRLRIRVFVIRGGEREDDATISARFRDRFEPELLRRVELVPYLEDPEATFREVTRCDAFIATRYHAAILAYLAGCKLLLLAYHRKLSDLVSEIGLGPAACIALSEPFSDERLRRSLNGLFNGCADFTPRFPTSDAIERSSLNAALVANVLGTPYTQAR
jgi:polysaccharide pyruvyl transferase WcaK-like protein